ncbi:MAG: TolC family protein, partial [bacterium]
MRDRALTGTFTGLSADPSVGTRLVSIMAVLFLSLAAAGCAPGRKYERPEVEVPTAYREGAPWKEASPSDDLPRGRWWKVFGDSVLDGLLERVRSANQDLAAAAARVEQARALAAAAGAGSLPVVSLNPSAERRRTADDLSSSGSGQASNTLKVPLDLSYEVDLFGRVKGGAQAAASEFAASRADFENLLLTLQA